MADGEASVRLDKILANLGYGSRADVKKWITWGEAAIAGPDGSIRVQNDPGAKVKPSTVRFRREPLERIEGICVLLHKPVGYVCSHDEDEGPRIYDLLPEQWSRRNPQIVSIGRLDKDSSGLIVVTDNHPLVHRLTSTKPTSSPSTPHPSPTPSNGLLPDPCCWKKTTSRACPPNSPSTANPMPMVRTRVK
jgi:16S rRNA U516 pseudouridylate synthase RsuA-like enzyme